MAEILQPANWPRPKGYSNGLVVSGRQVFLSGMIGWDSSGRLVSNEFAAQVRQALLNVLELLAQAKAGPELFTRPRRFCSRPALVRGAEMAESRGRTSGCVADAARDCRAGIAR